MADELTCIIDIAAFTDVHIKALLLSYQGLCLRPQLSAKA
jgi:hypothetical protein